MIEAIVRVPNGRYEAEMTLDGYEEPVRLKLRMTVEDERIVLDYSWSWRRRVTASIRRNAIRTRIRSLA